MPQTESETERETGGFEMQVDPVDPAALPGPGPAGAEAGGGRRPADAAVADAMFRAGCAGLNSVILGLTGYRELELTGEEIDQLDELWSPFLPAMSPILAAIIGTVIIAGGKLALYRKLRKGGRHGPADARGDVREAVAGSGGDATERAAAAAA